MNDNELNHEQWTPEEEEAERQYIADFFASIPRTELPDELEFGAWLNSLPLFGITEEE